MMISKEHQEYLNSIKQLHYKVVIARLLILTIFFILWELLGDLRIIDPFLTSTPSRMLKSLITIYKEGTLFKHIFTTCFETILGFTLGTLLGTLIAIILWWSEFLCKVLDPYLVVLNALPKVALGPIIIFWVGNAIPINLQLYSYYAYFTVNHLFELHKNL